MTVLVDAAWRAQRKAVAAGPLAPLAASLATELDQHLPGERVFIPAEKAKLTRWGGRCADDGQLLEFDPHQPRRHRCPQCGREYEGEDHYRWWVMGYQLWLAERAVHAAVLWALGGDDRHRRLADAILGGYAERYLTYPNVDNVLGPTRVFFSTYLESIWLLQLAIAIDVLEACDGPSPLGAVVRDRVVEPSMALIALYDEGLSNRQVWNNAALAAAGRLLDRRDVVDGALYGPSGLVTHLDRGLLADGTWYEGENYHHFAHRGLWYLVTMASHAAAGLPAALAERFQEGFATPFLTALPDFTMPARRDSPYRVSLRQWRFAEACELGLARRPSDQRLVAALARLYETTPAPATDEQGSSGGDTARWRSTAEAERNVAGARLTRADLGWKSLLFALPTLPEMSAGRAPGSTLLEGQGLAVLRRDDGAVYIALDYGHSGGGHGHPDRLNLWLVSGRERILEDVGTGSYVDPTLHWYRSTLAHNAPLIDGRSQPRTSGTLHAFDDQGTMSWVSAAVDLPPATVRRSVVVLEDYMVDLLAWDAAHEVQIDVPMHVVGDLEPRPPWRAAVLTGGHEPDDGFSFVLLAEYGGMRTPALLRAGSARAWVHVDAPHEWWKCEAPGPPGQGARPFLLVRGRGTSGTIVSVWAWKGAVHEVTAEPEGWRVRLGHGRSHLHRPLAREWRVVEESPRGERSVTLAGRRRQLPADTSDVAPRRALPTPIVVPRLARVPATPGELTRRSAEAGPDKPWRGRLGREHYRRSEQAWSEAGAPEGLVVLAATADTLCVEVTVRKAAPYFAPWREQNPLDNEHPDINSDGVQLHLRGPGAPDEPPHYSWILVPDPGADRVRVTPRRRDGPSIALAALWRRTDRGYQVLAKVPRAAVGSGTTGYIDVAINEIDASRERRRGQLVLSGARGEWIYLRGDRLDPERYLPFRIADD